MTRGRAATAAKLGLLVAPLTGCASFVEWIDPPEAPSPALPANSPAELQRDPVDRFGVALLEPDDAIVRVVSAGVACSGTLIAPDQVLTAHHCISERTDDGDIMSTDVAPSQITVEVGGDYLPWADVTVREVVAPSCGHATGVGDIAILILDRPLEGAPMLAVRLDKGPETGEAIEPVGFGRCALSPEGIRRRARPGGAVRTVSATRFQLEAAICPGDSGGPALDRQGAVVGIISASAMDANEATRDRTEFTRLDAWRAVFATARSVSEGAALAELPPIDGCPG